MPGQLDVYDFGGGGVNLVKNPLELEDNELTQAINAELIRDINTGGKGSLSKRGGLTPLNGTPLAGAIIGITPVPLNTTFVRTLYASLATAAANTWSKTTSGTSWADIATPLRATVENTGNYNTIGTNASVGGRRLAAFRTFLVYSGSDYVADITTPANNTALDMDSWNATDAAQLFRLQPGNATTDGNYPFSVTDMLVANDSIYFAVHDSPNSGTDKQGRVLAFSMITGQISQVASGFGGTTGNMTGGVPVALVWYQGKLWVGLNNGNGTANVGKVVWCYPGIDTSWTVDSAVLKGYINSMAVYNGDLFAGLTGNVTNPTRVIRRAASTGTWSDSDTGQGGTNQGYASLSVYNSELYAVVSFQTASDIQLIRKFDGSSWTTDRDVKASDWTTQTDPPAVGNAVLYNGDLYIVFLATTASATDGFILRKHSGAWSKVASGNYSGYMGVLTERS